MALWLDLKIGQEGSSKALIELHMEDVETVAQVMDRLQAMMKAFGLA